MVPVTVLNQPRSDPDTTGTQQVAPNRRVFVNTFPAAGRDGYEAAIWRPAALVGDLNSTLLRVQIVQELSI